ncbi:hypothetical protein FQA39_LY06131 [Lamprigera yunnana]|nr:hypothetical protein FQA39_LY06131 [Lamprigera yunnana]
MRNKPRRKHNRQRTREQHQLECNELVVTAKNGEIPVNDADTEFDVGRDEILTDEEVEHRTNLEGDEVLEKVEEEIVGEETLDSVTEGKDLEPLDHAVPVVLSNLHTHTKADALRISDVENGKARERIRSPSDLKKIKAHEHKIDSSRLWSRLWLLRREQMEGTSVLIGELETENIDLL